MFPIHSFYEYFTTIVTLPANRVAPLADEQFIHGVFK
jgi:hypothetical protein